jgi:glycyl-tRNA synthetase
MRKECVNLLERKFFFVQSFEIYNGVSGFYDYGPLGCAVKQNVENFWRNHFVLEEDMLEMSCSNIMLDEVLQTSGHVDKFADFMVKDTKSGTPRRADKLIEEHFEAELAKKKKPKPEVIAEMEKIMMDVETYDASQLDEVITKWKIKDPISKAELTKAELFNLMFTINIGPTG